MVVREKKSARGKYLQTNTDERKRSKIRNVIKEEISKKQRRDF